MYCCLNKYINKYFLLSADSCLSSEKLSSFYRNKLDIILLPVGFRLSAQPLGCVIFSFHTTFSCICYLCILCACLVIRFMWQQITQISCCYADLNLCWCVISHPKTHDLLCIYHEVQLGNEHRLHMSVNSQNDCTSYLLTGLYTDAP